jgi:hypothetical protein
MLVFPFSRWERIRSLDRKTYAQLVRGSDGEARAPESLPSKSPIMAQSTHPQTKVQLHGERTAQRKLPSIRPYINIVKRCLQT